MIKINAISMFVYSLMQVYLDRGTNFKPAPHSFLYVPSYSLPLSPNHPLAASTSALPSILCTNTAAVIKKGRVQVNHVYISVPISHLHLIPPLNWKRSSSGLICGSARFRNGHFWIFMFGSNMIGFWVEIDRELGDRSERKVGMS